MEREPPLCDEVADASSPSLESDYGDDEAADSSSAPTTASLFLRRKPKPDGHSYKLLAKEKLPAELTSALVILLLILTVLVPALLFTTIQSSQIVSFTKELEETASAIHHAVGHRLASTMAVVDGLSISMTSSAIDSDSSWPFASLSFFEEWGDNVAFMADALQLTYHPHVSDDNRDGWEKYTRDNARIILDAQDRVDARTREAMADRNSSATVISHIYREDSGGTGGIVIEDSPGPYYPAWQIYPITNTGVNFNLRSVPAYRSAIDELIRHRQPVVGPTITFDINENSPQQNRFTKLLQKHTEDPSVTYQGEPTTSLLYPVFGDFDLVTRDVVGLFDLSIFWPAFFRDIVPENTPPVLCVVRSECGSVFTVQVDGNKTSILGVEDLHDTTYDDTSTSRTFIELLRVYAFQFDGLVPELDHGYCPYTLEVYATDEIYDKHVTSTPIIIGCVTAALFLFLIIIVGAYTFLMKHSHQRIAKIALKSGGLVSQLYPEMVRDRLLNRASNKPQLQNTEENLQYRLSKSDAPVMMKSIIQTNKTGHTIYKEGIKSSKPVEKLSDPIAESFSDCTVFFSYIKGFDEWSDKHDPVEVFQLLEAVFQSFDKRAKRHKVFKVETIADSYMAVTGVPDQDDTHALRMARYARDCMISVQRLIATDLAEILGPDTRELRVVMGLHSGPIMAGVLQGQKTRFQLFGDTVNFASRMASTCLLGRIQVSKTTADLLQDSGKSKWLDRRNGGVVAKGKGVLDTWWLSYESAATSSAGTSISEWSSLAPSSTTDSANENIDDHLDLDGSQFGDVETEFGTLDLDTTTDEERKLIDNIVDLLRIQLKLTALEFGMIEEYSKNKPEMVAELTDFVSSLLPKAPGEHGLPHAAHAAISATKLLDMLDENKIADEEDEEFQYNKALSHFAVVAVTVAQGSLVNDSSPNVISSSHERIDEAIDSLVSGPNNPTLQLLLFADDEARTESFRELMFYLTHFSEFRPPEQYCPKIVLNLALIVNAACVSHAMQKWEVFKAWSERRLQRTTMSITEWYGSELKFFTKQVLPLAWQLRDNNIFDDTTLQCFTYAAENRCRWECEGNACLS